MPIELHKKRTGVAPSEADSDALAPEPAEHYGIPQIEPSEWPESPVLSDRLSPAFLAENSILPLRIDERGHLIVAVADPGDERALSSLRLAVGRPLELRLASRSDISIALNRLGREHSALIETEARSSAATSEDIEQLNDLALEAPIIELVNSLLQDAVARRATDLHIEPGRNRVILRQRIDGLLREAGALEPNVGRAAISRLKILSRLNIAERRLPQDGQARLRINDCDYDLRIVTIPTIHGESAAIRILAAATQVPALERLGLSARDEGAFRSALAAANGLVIVTGPTGSGKTTTLAAGLGFLNEPHRKIVTIEDPVEYQIDGINQVQVRSEIGITFSHALRSILRYDPDVLMVGEVRDSETAQIAVQASLTGHLVLTTLHTNSAAGAVTRLLDMGVPGYLLASSLRCVVGQRLVRALCPHCKEPARVIPAFSPEALVDTGLAPGEAIDGWTARGCERCNGTGYAGRLAIFEVLAVDDRLRRLIGGSVDTEAVAVAARQSGMTTMIVDGLEKCRRGLTTADEVARVVMTG
ncbi:GspE/PulE family protein [Parvibaculum sp.]|uniref:GspE/PulE family protein n=1 Tax=Parvibaculum sp. TaxID=2024848 RepID=UPI00320F98C7